MFAIPELAIFVVSLALLLLVLAGLAFLRFLHDATDGLPWPLNLLSGAVLSFQENTLQRIRGWALKGLSAAGLVLLAMFDIPIRLFEHVVSALESVVELGAHLRAYALELQKGALAWAWDLAVSVQRSLAEALATVDRAIATQAVDTAHAIDALAGTVAGEVAAIDRAMADDVARLEGTIDAGIADVAEAIVHDVAAAEGYMARALAGAVAGLEADVAAARSDVIDWVTSQVEDLAKSIDRTGAAAAAGTAAAVAGVLSLIRTGVMATVATISTELDDCVRPNCTWMKSLGSTFSSLASALEVVALLGFLAEAIINPGATATVVEDLVNPIADVVYTAMSDVLGALY
jgi:hypothetical protein